MEEIRIYRSIWMNAISIVWLIISVFLLFSPLLISVLFPEITLKSFIDEIIDQLGILRGSGFIFLWGLFSLAFLWGLYRLLQELIRRIPYYIITDRGFIMEHNNMEILFADVEEFFINKVGKNKWIEIRYKSGVDLMKYERTGFFVRIIRHFFTNYDCTLKIIYANGLSISTQNLCELLNERLAAAKKKERKFLYR